MQTNTAPNRPDPEPDDEDAREREAARAWLAGWHGAETLAGGELAQTDAVFGLTAVRRVA